MTFLLHLLIVFCIPLLIVRYEKSIKLIDWIGPVVCSYILGVLVGNFSYGLWDASIARDFSEITVIFAIPMLLLATDLLGWLKLAKATIFSFLLLIFSVITTGLIAGKLFEGQDPELWKMVGMIVGVYIGGTPNLTAIGKILEIREEVFITLNAVDLAIGGGYLLFIMSFGVKLLTILLKPFDFSSVLSVEYQIANWSNIKTQQKVINSLFLLLICLGIVGVSFGFSKFLFSTVSAGAILFGVTILSVALSLLPRIRNLEGSQEIGHFFLLCFCFSVGSMASIENILIGKMWYFLFCLFVLIGSVLLHFILCYVFKIDRDTAIITSMAGVFGPAFIAPMSDVLKNRAMLVSGITCGLVGIAIGNFIGVWVAYILK